MAETATKTKPSDATLADFRSLRTKVNKAALNGRLSAYYLDSTWETQLPTFKTALMEIPSPSNPLGVRAGGEGGTTPALAAVINAIVDALKDYGVTHMEMPATSERVWRAIQDGRAKTPTRHARA